MKTITTSTEITFTKTNEKFELIQNENGFDVKPIKLSKNIATEPYTFQELLDLYEAGNITIAGFEPEDKDLVRSQFTNYIYQNNLKAQLEKNNEVTGSFQKVVAEKEELTAQVAQLTAQVQELTEKNKELTNEVTYLTKENEKFSEKIEKLNEALATMNEEEENQSR